MPARCRCVVLLALIPLAGSGCLAEESFLAPDDSIEESPGVYIVRRDNPTLRGNVQIATVVDGGGDFTYLDRHTMGPNAGYITADVPDSFDWYRGNRGYVWSEDTAAVATIGAAAFLSPSVRLPIDYAPVVFTLNRVNGRTLTDPPDDTSQLPPIGLDEVELDTQEVRLADDVLVLPVRVSVLGPAGGGLVPGWPNEALIRGWFDPGPVTTISASTANFATSSSVTVQSGRYHDTGGSIGYENTPPDAIWEQCGIQFRVIDYEVIPQALGLEDQLLTGCLCDIAKNFVNPAEPVTNFINGVRTGDDMLQVFLGGEIEGLDCPGGTTYGLACGVPIHDQVACPTQVDAHPFEAHAIFVDIARVDDRNSVISHEFGHMLGLNHTTGGDTCVELADGEDTSGYLMNSGGGAVLSDNQCERARCIALQWLDHYGSVPPGHIVQNNCPAL